ncbi:hypothetical protein DPMN_022079 [Dreissena polymorpha]|uniref:Uncharacterized protein n=1 Tax=Dreissena polymorpha TaxID=45954 RepID=A0A9D4SBG8_DREPO|nr:hypothetical protein DPMN_022079 [Dreissena polymorpha]
MSPPRIPMELYKDLHFLPDAVLDLDGQYKCFNDVYGTETKDSDRPSLKVKPEATDRDKRFKSVLVAGMHVVVAFVVVAFVSVLVLFTCLLY